MIELNDAPSRQEKAGIVLPDSIPQALGQLALLTPEEESIRQAWQGETDPDLRVEGFLEASAGIFMASSQSWRNIKLAQGAFIETNTSMIEQQDAMLNLQPRHQR